MRFPSTRSRHSIRLRGYDYTTTGDYFVTLCTLGRECLFGEVETREVKLSEIGTMARLFWEEIPRHFQNVVLDSWIIMPNHIHGILSIRSGRPTTSADAQNATSKRCVLPGSLGAIIRSFKAVTARKVNEIRGTQGWTIWQRNYYEHIIQTPVELMGIRRYINDNPLQWDLDRENPRTVPLVELPQNWWDS